MSGLCEATWFFLYMSERHWRSRTIPYYKDVLMAAILEPLHFSLSGRFEYLEAPVMEHVSTWLLIPYRRRSECRI